MIERELRKKAIELRENGRSYNYISKKTGLSKGTLFYIFSKIKIPEEILLANKRRNLEESRERIIIYGKIRKTILENKYSQIQNYAKESFERYKNDPIFIASLMLYLGEGDKGQNGTSLRICNTDPSVLKIFLRFLDKYCSEIEKNKIKFWMLGYDDMNIENCLSWWLTELNISRTNLYKTQIIKGRHKSKRLIYGVGNITISSKSLRVKVIKWMELMCEYLTRP